MTRYSRFVLIVILLWMVNGSLPVCAQTNQQGDIVTLIEQIRNAMPGQNSNGFVVPSSSDIANMGTVIDQLKNGQVDSVVAMSAAYGYSLIRWFNVPTGETLFVLKENSPIQRGWGTYLFNPNGTLDCTIEIPHPVWDTKSWRLGILDYLRLQAKWFCMAGTHRYANPDSSSDVAHSTRTIFYKAHQVIATDVAVQIHGFDKSNSIYTGYPDAVISSGSLYPNDLLFSVKTAYEEQGFTAGVYSLSTQSSLSRLGATTNKEGQWSNANGKIFIHIEHDTPIRTDTAKTTKAIVALAQALQSTPADVPPAESIPGHSSLCQNYPNPFNPETRIQFYVGQQGMVNLSIYNIIGEEVATLVHERLHPGFYTRTWNASASHVPGGLYLLTYTQEQFRETRKLLFIQ